MKVIFIAFANSADEPLAFLTAEDNAVYKILNEQYSMGDYIVHRESYATPENIIQSLEKYKEDLAIFHFSGHAGNNKLLVDDQAVFSKGIAKLLNYSAEKGTLKLVILNGCSTCSQVKLLQQNKVPAIISTSAPVDDKSAKEFSIRLWEKLVRDERAIEDAYADALSVADALIPQDLDKAYTRHLFTEDDDECGVEDKPLWRLDAIDENAIKINPIPYKDQFTGPVPVPNKELIDTLYRSFCDAQNPEILDLDNKQRSGRPVTESARQIAIVNSIPFPMGIHLQKLICPTAGSDEEGYDENGIKRLEQIAQFFQITTEFLCIVMIAQMWELFVRFPKDFMLNPALKEKLKEYVELDEKKREVFNYITLTREIREYLENLNPANAELKGFIDEQEVLKDLFLFDDDFRNACNYLADLRVQCIQHKIDESRAAGMCIKAEKQLCVFVKPLGFIHRYHLTSVQNIDILKYRHIASVDTKYKHRIIRCMQAIGKDEWNYYYIKTFLDNWGVILLKCEITLREEKNYDVTVKDFLNLSPFVIDGNSFVERTDLANIMFFQGEAGDTINFKKVKNPLKQRDSLPVNKHPNAEDRFESIRVQYNAFKEFIA